MANRDNVNERIIRLWQPRSATPLTPTDAIEIRESVSNFLAVMRRITERQTTPKALSPDLPITMLSYRKEGAVKVDD